MSKKTTPRFQIAVFNDGKILIVSDIALTRDQTTRLGEQISQWYDNKVPAAMCIPNAEIFMVNDKPGGKHDIFGIASPSVEKADTSGMN